MLERGYRLGGGYIRLKTRRSALRRWASSQDETLDEVIAAMNEILGLEGVIMALILANDGIDKSARRP